MAPKNKSKSKRNISHKNNQQGNLQDNQINHSNKHRVVNVRRSKTDRRDWFYQGTIDPKKRALIVPHMLDYRPVLPEVRDQGDVGTCMAMSVACMKEWQEGFQDKYMSPQFIYNCRDYWNNGVQDGDDVNEDYGMTGRDAMRILHDIGIVKEDEYRYGNNQKASDISRTILNMAQEYKIKHYAQVYTVEQLKEALHENGVCIITFPVFNFSNKMWVKLGRLPTRGEIDNPTYGGHAMAVVGYTADSFIIRNSWGKNWGYDGYCYYPFEEFNHGCHWEIWTTIDLDKPNMRKKLIIPSRIGCMCF